MAGKYSKREMDNFVRLLTEAQLDLHAYLAYLIGDTTDAYDVLQETNIALWRKAALYDPKQPFLVWARRFAHFQYLKFRKDRSRDALVFDNDLVERVAARAESESSHHRLLAIMERCLQKLNPGQRELMRAKYQEGESLASLAQRKQSTVSAIGMLLMRIRRILAECIREGMAREGVSL